MSSKTEPSPAASLGPGACVGPFEIVKPLGAGGMGEVHLARDRRLHRLVALKVAPVGARGAQARLAREARLVAMLAHPGFVAVHELGTEGGRVFVAMELVDGENVADLLLHRGAPPAPVAAAVGAAIGGAMAACHDVGVVHRDLKPANVMIRRDGVLKVLDFGIAVAAAERFTKLTLPGQVMGTLAYVSPERLGGGADSPAADVWALAMIVAELASGRHPLVACRGVGEIVEAIMRGGILDPLVLPGGLRRVLEPALSAAPSGRPTARQLASELEALAAGADLGGWAWKATPPPASPASTVGVAELQTASVPSGGLDGLLGDLSGRRLIAPFPRLVPLALVPLPDSLLGRLRRLEVGVLAIRLALCVGLASLSRRGDPWPPSVTSALRTMVSGRCASWLAACAAIVAVTQPDQRPLVVAARAVLASSALPSVAGAFDAAMKAEAAAGWEDALRVLLQGAEPLLSAELVDGGTPDGTCLVVDGAAVPVSPFVEVRGGTVWFLDAPICPGDAFQQLAPEIGVHVGALRLEAASAADPSAVPATLPSFVGRGEELDALRAAADQALLGHCALVRVVGPVGVGRSRLLREARVALGARFARVVVGDASPHVESGLLGGLAGALRGALGGPVRSVVDRLSTAAAVAEPHAVQRAIQDLADAILAEASSRAILLEVDDVHESPAAVRSLVEFLDGAARRRASGRLLVVASWATDGPAPRAPVALDGHVSCVDLGPLSLAETLALIQGVGPLSGGDAQAVASASGGRPLFILHGARLAAAGGAPAEGQGTEVLPRVAQVDLETVVAAQVAACFDPASSGERAAWKLLSIVARAGRLPMAVARQLLLAEEQMGPEDVAAALEHAGLVCVGSDGALRAAGSAIGAAAVRLTKERPWTHGLWRRAVDAIAAHGQDEDAATIGEAWLAFDEPGRALRWLALATLRNLSRGDPVAAEASAATMHAAARACRPPNTIAAARAALWVVDARLRRGGGAEVGPWLAEAQPATPELALESALLAARAGLLDGRRADGLPAVADALGVPRLSAEARLAAGLLARGTRGAALLREGLRFADQCPSSERGELEVRLLAGLVEVLRENGSGARPECRAVAVAAADAARRAGSVWGELDVELTLAALAADDGELEHALERLGVLARRAEALGHLGIARQALTSRAGVLLRAGRLDEATLCAKLAVTRSETVGGVALGQALGLLAEAHARRGAHAEALAFLERGIGARGAEPGVALLWLRRASSQLALGRADAALADAQRALSSSMGQNVDLERRSRLWLAVHRAPPDPRELAAAIDACRDESSLRPPTRELLIRAHELLTGRNTTDV